MPRCTIYEIAVAASFSTFLTSQLVVKRRQVIDAIERIGGLEDVPVHPVKGMEKPLELPK